MKMEKTLFILSMLLLILQASELFAQRVVVVTRQPKVVIVPETELIVIPGTYIYYLSVDEDDIFFFRGYWWWCQKNRWYRASSYSGPWTAVSLRYVPVELTKLPPRWREAKREHPRVRWVEVKDQWQEWERERYWEKRGWRRVAHQADTIERREKRIRKSRRR